MKNKLKQVGNHFKSHGSFYLLIIIIFSWTMAYNQTVKLGRDYFQEPKRQSIHLITQAVEAQAPESLTPKEYMLNRIKEEGLSVKTAECIMTHESKGNPSAIGVNTNKSADVGYWQINSIHIKAKHISLTCAVNYHCATEWVIDKVKNDGNWSAWSTYKKYCK